MASIESEGTLSKAKKEEYASSFWTTIENLWYSYQDKYHAAVETLAGLKDSDSTVEDAADKRWKNENWVGKFKYFTQKKEIRIWC